MGLVDSFVGVLLIISVTLFLIFLLILWTLLPFAVFGVKAKLEQLIGIQAYTLESINDLRRIAKIISGESTPQQTPNEDPTASVTIDNIKQDRIKKEIMNDLSQGAVFIRSRTLKKFKITDQDFNKMCDILHDEGKIEDSQRDQLKG